MIYLSIPFTGMEYVSVRVSCRVAASLMRNGYVVFSPILNSHAIVKFGEINSEDYDFWIKYAKEVIWQCDEMYVIKLPGWETSNGVQTEIKEALAAGLTVKGIDPLGYVAPRELEQWANCGWTNDKRH